MIGGPERPNPEAERFPVAGAGELCVGPNSSTGSAVGLSIAVSWGSYRYAGGVMDRREVAALHDLLGRWLDGSYQFREVDPIVVVSGG